MDLVISLIMIDYGKYNGINHLNTRLNTCLPVLGTTHSSSKSVVSIGQIHWSLTHCELPEQNSPFAQLSIGFAKSENFYNIIK